ncbi:MAG: hypothetical protein GY842_17465 [bacterium]|nr:hypothetical protein [bacterium]
MRKSMFMAVGGILLSWTGVHATDLVIAVVPDVTQASQDEVVTFEIYGTLTPDSEGLGLIGFDFDLDGVLFPSQLVDGAGMENFVGDEGLTSPDGYGGTLSGATLLQVGGGQNTIGNTAVNAPYPIGDPIDLGVANTPQVIAEGSFTMPGEDIALNVTNCFANVITSDTAGPVYPVESVGTCADATVTVTSGPCSDGNPCTEDVWDGEQCEYTPLPNGTPCPDDEDPCTWDRCAEGICEHPTCVGCPVISRQPQCLAVPVGADAVFTVGVSPSMGSVQVEWFKDDVPAGSGDELIIPDVQAEDHNLQVRCRVTDNCGTTNSNTVLLSVDINVVYGDSDGDCDVDLDDYAAFQRCFTQATPSTACLATLDLDSDGNFDLDDYALFFGELGPTGGACSYSDVWTTDVSPGNETVYDFGTNGRAIPADFFKPGSDPFAEEVEWAGVASVDPDDPDGADTQVVHAPLRFPAYDGQPIVRQVEARLNALSLVGKDLIMVSSSGVDTAWYVSATLSEVDPGSGTITATLTHDNGGVFDAVLYVQPLFLFAHAQDVDDYFNLQIPIEQVRLLELDTGLDRQAPIVLQFSDRPFSISIPPGLNVFPHLCAMGDFVPGVDTSGGRAQTTCVSHITPEDRHYFCPPECFECQCTYELAVALNPACPDTPTERRVQVLCTNDILPDPDGTCPDADPDPCQPKQDISGPCPRKDGVVFRGLYQLDDQNPCMAVLPEACD